MLDFLYLRNSGGGPSVRGRSSTMAAYHLNSRSFLSILAASSLSSSFFFSFFLSFCWRGVGGRDKLKNRLYKTRIQPHQMSCPLIHVEFRLGVVVWHIILSMFGKFLVHAWSQCMHVSTKNILYWFIGDQTSFSTSSHVKMCLVLNEVI